jgi:hypothetical protein
MADLLERARHNARVWKAERDRLIKQVEKMAAYIAEREGEEVVLCCVCGEPVWPSLTLWQRPEGRSLTYGHRRCLDAKYPPANDDTDGREEEG